MPSPYVQKLAKETDKSVDEIEKLWNKAKEITADHFDKSEDDFGEREFAYTVGIVKNMTSADEKLENPEFFLNSSLSAKEFIEDALASGTMISANVNLPDDHPIINKKKKGDDEEEKEEIEKKNEIKEDEEFLKMNSVEIEPLKVVFEEKPDKVVENILKDREGWL